MSYARSSEPDSDIYIFGTRDSIEVYVANNRGSANTVPFPAPGSPAEDFEAYFADVIEWDHHEAGKAYSFTSYAECLARLDELRASGVGIPQRAFDRLRQEAEQDGDQYAI